MYEYIIVEKKDNGVGLIRLNRPKVYNALNKQLMQELVAALAAHDNDPAVGCNVITGNEKAFAAGADIKAMAEASPADMYLDGAIEVWDGLNGIKKPIIAAVSGLCLGGGCEMAMACDMIVASETARFGQPEIKLGIIPGAGGTQRLTHAVGKAIAMEMVLNDRWLSAEEAHHFGLINYIYSVEEYLDKALEMAAGIATRAPVAVQIAKESVNKAYEMALAEGLAFERRNCYFLFGTEDQKEGMKAFIEKREPEWKGK